MIRPTIFIFFVVTFLIHSHKSLANYHGSTNLYLNTSQFCLLLDIVQDLWIDHFGVYLCAIFEGNTTTILSTMYNLFGNYCINMCCSRNSIYTCIRIDQELCEAENIMTMLSFSSWAQKNKCQLIIKVIVTARQNCTMSFFV